MRAGFHIPEVLSVLLAGVAFACSDNKSTSSDESADASRWGEACQAEHVGDYVAGAGVPEQECVDIINAYRAKHAQPALARWESAESCVRSQAEADATATDAHAGFGNCGELAQNTCPGWPSVETVLGGCLLNMYCEGPSQSGQWDNAHGHHMNMVSNDYTQVACGFYPMSDGSYWVNIDFK